MVTNPRNVPDPNQKPQVLPDYWEPFPSRYVDPELTPPTNGKRIPLINADRQSLIVRFAVQDCRLRVYWNPTDSAWYCDVEVPAGNIVQAGKRLNTDTPVLPRTNQWLPGNIWCRAASTDAKMHNPHQRDDFADTGGTKGHVRYRLMWEPN